MKYAAHDIAAIYATGDTPEAALANAHAATGEDEAGFEVDEISDRDADEIEAGGFDGNVDAFEVRHGRIVLDLRRMRDRPRRSYWTVSIYLVDRAYGGPEEGGWWYTCGERVEGRAPKVFRDERAASAYAQRMEHWLRRLVNRHRHPISSVMSLGVYAAEVHEGDAPSHFPAIRPHYE